MSLIEQRHPQIPRRTTRDRTLLVRAIWRRALTKLCTVLLLFYACSSNGLDCLDW